MDDSRQEKWKKWGTLGCFVFLQNKGDQVDDRERSRKMPNFDEKRNNTSLRYAPPVSMMLVSDCLEPSRRDQRRSTFG